MKSRSLPFLSAVCSLILLLSAGCSGPRPDDLGITEGQFSPCPSSPHCVSSQTAAGDDHHIDAFDLIMAPEQAWTGLQTVITAMPRTRIITARPDYLHAETQTPTIGFTDDLEFYLDRDDNAIQVRSSSRIGYWDWGTNRNRVEHIRSVLQEDGIISR
jgi:uncharacterized protein (DUF1499 family)